VQEKSENLLLGGSVLEGAHDALEESHPHDRDHTGSDGDRRAQRAATELERRDADDCDQQDQNSNVQKSIQSLHSNTSPKHSATNNLIGKHPLTIGYSPELHSEPNLVCKSIKQPCLTNSHTRSIIFVKVRLANLCYLSQ